jgi:hypothetical protein
MLLGIGVGSLAKKVVPGLVAMKRARARAAAETSNIRAAGSLRMVVILSLVSSRIGGVRRWWWAGVALLVLLAVIGFTWWMALQPSYG